MQATLTRQFRVLHALRALRAKDRFSPVEAHAVIAATAKRATQLPRRVVTSVRPMRCVATGPASPLAIRPATLATPAATRRITVNGPRGYASMESGQAEFGAFAKTSAAVHAKF